MKTSELLRVVDQGWARKPKGFRVHFQKVGAEDLTTDYVPGEEEPPFDSDVVAWRSAWKLFQVSQSNHPELGGGRLINIYVVDDSGRRVKYYATGRYDCFNPIDDEVCPGADHEDST